MSTLDILLLIGGFVGLVSVVIDGTVVIYKFVRRLRHRLREPIHSTESKKLLYLWQLTILLILVVPCFIAAGVILFLTMNLQVFLEVLVLLVVFIVSVSLMPWTVPAFVEIVTEYAKKRWG